jgi:hypothetical protein
MAIGAGSDSHGKGGKRKGSHGHPADMSFGRKFGFKMFVPDVLATSIIGKGGRSKDAIQNQTGCKLVLSNRDEYYPGTRLQTLVVYGGTQDELNPVFEEVINRTIELGNEEQVAGRREHDDPETLLGKGQGEYVVRCAIEVRMRGGIIGNRGWNLQQLRNECNAKIFIDDKHCYQGHQLLTCIAPEQGLKWALPKLNELVQKESQDCDWYMDWLNLRVFDGSEDRKGESKGEGKANRRSKADSKGKKASKGGKGKGKHGDRSWGDDYSRRRSRSRSPRRGNDQQDWTNEHGDAAHGGWHNGGEDQLQLIHKVVAEVPPELLEREHVLTCDLPADMVQSIFGPENCFAEEVRQKTGIDVRAQETDNVENEDGACSTLTFEGPALQVYSAHALFMHKYHECERELEREREQAEREERERAEQTEREEREREQAEEAEREREREEAEREEAAGAEDQNEGQVAALKKQLEELQKQMEALKNTSGQSGSQEKGGRGKGKGKGKSKK